MVEDLNFTMLVVRRNFRVFEALPTKDMIVLCHFGLITVIQIVLNQSLNLPNSSLQNTNNGINIEHLFYKPCIVYRHTNNYFYG